LIRHELLSISLNSLSKWKVRVLPSLKDSFVANGVLPPGLCFSLAALATFYRSSERGDGCLIGKRGAETYPIRDDARVLDFFATHAEMPAPQLAEALLGNTAFWGEDLNALGDMTAQVTGFLERIEEKGMAAAIQALIG